MQSAAGLRQATPGAQPAWFGPEGRRGVEDSRQRGPLRGLRSRLHAREGEPCGEVDDGGPSVSPRARPASGQAVQGRERVLRRGRQSPRQRSPLSRGGDDRGGCDRVLPALWCTLEAASVGKQQTQSMDSIILLSTASTFRSLPSDEKVIQ